MNQSKSKKKNKCELRFLVRHSFGSLCLCSSFLVAPLALFCWSMMCYLQLLNIYIWCLWKAADSTYFYKFHILGEEQRCNGNSVSAGEVGWYILGANQQHVGPYASLELLGKLQGIAENWKSCSFNWKSVLVFFLFDLKGNLLKLNDLDYFECWVCRWTYGIPILLETSI